MEKVPKISLLSSPGFSCSESVSGAFLLSLSFLTSEASLNDSGSGSTMATLLTQGAQGAASGGAGEEKHLGGLTGQTMLPAAAGFAWLLLKDLCSSSVRAAPGAAQQPGAASRHRCPLYVT